MAVLAAFREKSPEAFRTISEVATDLDMPQHVLRFWESRFAQVRPIKRAGDAATTVPKTLTFFAASAHCFIAKVTRSRAHKRSFAKRAFVMSPSLDV